MTTAEASLLPPDNNFMLDLLFTVKSLFEFKKQEAKRETISAKAILALQNSLLFVYTGGWGCMNRIISWGKVEHFMKISICHVMHIAIAPLSHIAKQSIFPLYSYQ
jgi:hypothetical protein